MSKIIIWKFGVLPFLSPRGSTNDPKRNGHYYTALGICPIRNLDFVYNDFAHPPAHVDEQTVGSAVVEAKGNLLSKLRAFYYVARN